MCSLGHTFWQDDDDWLGYLGTYPDHMTQGTSGEEIPGIRKKEKSDAA